MPGAYLASIFDDFFTEVGGITSIAAMVGEDNAGGTFGTTLGPLTGQQAGDILLFGAIRGNTLTPNPGAGTTLYNATANGSSASLHHRTAADSSTNSGTYGNSVRGAWTAVRNGTYLTSSFASSTGTGTTLTVPNAGASIPSTGALILVCCISHVPDDFADVLNVGGLVDVTGSHLNNTNGSVRFFASDGPVDSFTGGNATISNGDWFAFTTAWT